MKPEKFTRNKAILKLVQYNTSSTFAEILKESTNDELKEWLIDYNISKNPIIK